MGRTVTLVVLGLFLAGLVSGPQAAAAEGKVRRLPVAEYVSRMKAGWIGQMAGVGWGGPTEFKVKGEIIPEDRVPQWKPELINQFHQDDIYVEMTFLETLERYGLDCPIRQAGIDFANSGYPLWHANRAGRDNLRSGIAPPDSGHPQFNQHADDIDYQIEADYAGLIAPGMPNLVIRLGETFGRLMNYGDGVYGGQFVGGMYAEAFFTADMVEVAKAGLACIPAECQYAEMVRDVLAWYAKDPDDWQKTWNLIEEKYHKNSAYTHGLCGKPGGPGAGSIDAKLNGAYILMGLLYGKGDPDQTIVISTRCGQDSDCNPSNAGGILFTTIGFENLPDKYTSALNPEGTFSHTPYTFPKLIETCKNLVREALAKTGGKVETGADGQEVFVIPIEAPRPSALIKSYEPGPIANARFTDEEMARIKPPPPPARKAPQSPKKDIAKAVAAFAPGWTAENCGTEMDPGLRAEWGGRKNVLVTHPLSEAAGCVLSKEVAVPAGTRPTLRLVVGHDPRGDWTLVVKADDTVLARQKISSTTCTDGWRTIEVDLSPLAGKTVRLSLVNEADGWSWEAGYWAEVGVRSQ
ncbi:MAG: ADP-ribosylglycohydrolase family protein [Planctomycetes bacterium]|nr:ADP-ribosylglycohydrolase family protein [Planctomycetota bacterium]